MSPTEEAAFYCEAGLDRDGLENRGTGLFATKDFPKGSFLLEIVGERITEEEAGERKKRKRKKNPLSFYFFSWKGIKCIDATRTRNRFCHVANAAQTDLKENAAMKVKVFKNYPRLCLFSTKCIKSGEEICYNFMKSGNLPRREDTASSVSKTKSVNKFDELDDSKHEIDRDPFDVEKEGKTHQACKGIC
ncbi:histone-lysine N-methyltransferase SUV39H2-like [Saccostrea cucullata]|uniref:histone-lysine N-methyltransferase SUV39H2-like n=1 Tax=Saccostrea cuccullata TaxID=36930 RepID=UPI002ED25D81